MERFIKIFLTLILSCVIGLAGSLWVHGEESGEDEESLSGLYARAAVLADGENGRILWGKNEDEPMAMASTTKIMTCLVALENAQLSDLVEISEYAAGMPDVQLNAVAGDSFYLGDLLYALMLESDNDVAVAIAEHVGGSVEAFAEMMNVRAEELGCTQTCFVTPNGLDAEGHCTTAAELAKIASEAIKNETFVKIINTESHSFSNIEGTRQYQVNNKDAFLQLMDGAFGIKTGFTGDAGYCFVGALNSEGRIYISVVLGSGWPPNKSYKWKDTVSLMNYGMEKYEKQRIGNEALDVGTITVNGGCRREAVLKADCPEREFLMGKDEEAEICIVKDLSVEAPLAENTRVGWVYYKVGGETVERFPIQTAERVDTKSFGYCLKTMIRQWLTF
ncbi:D-alanyl-D-alanine carboxypeptidase family protein [Frisingicoccus sp.]|uniref:D-alanyl-D-alanine carboxypeptidase family protein n=1 Tax=Frisingicoccus sp. TaxID=1918627 RepID=UPI003AB40238